VVVNIINLQSIAFLELKDNAPIAIYFDGPKALEPPLKRVKVRPWKSHVFRSPGHVETKENILQTIGLVRLDSRLAPGGKEALKAFVPKAADHEEIVT